MRARVRALIAGSLAAGLTGGLVVVGAATVVAAPTAAPAPGTITTRVGGPGSGDALAVSQGPTRVSPGPGGSVYVADTSATVRQFTRASGTEKVVSGVAAIGFSGDGGLAVRAHLGMGGGGAGTYMGSAVPDHNGNLIIADAFNNRLRAVAARNGTFYGQKMVTGHIYTIVGTGAGAYSGDGGPARAASFDSTGKIAIDSAGNIVLPDLFSGRIRVVAAKTGTFYGQHMVAGDIYTVAGPGGTSLGNQGPATKGRLFDPAGVTVDHTGNLVIADSFDYRVRVVATATGLFYGKHMVAGDIYTIAGNGQHAYSGDGGPALDAGLGRPIAVTVDKAGNIAIADWQDPRVRMVAVKTGTFWGQHMKAGHIYTIAGTGTSGYFGNGGPAAKAGLSLTEDVAADATGNLLIADTGNNRVRVLAARNGTFYGVAMKAAHLYTIAGNGNRSESGDGGPALKAELARPEGVAVNGNGNIEVADTGGNRVRLAAATSGTFFGRKMVAGDIYTVAGNGKRFFDGDGGLATATAVSAPEGVATDHAGNLVIADTGDSRVRVVAARNGTFYRQKMTTGHIYTIAGNGDGQSSGDGGPATSAGVPFPSYVRPDAAGNLLLGQETPMVRVVAGKTGMFYGKHMVAGDIYTIAGTGVEGYTGDGGPATSAELGSIFGLRTDPHANVVISDLGNDRIRVVAAATGTFYGKHMVAGDIYTVAGDGTVGFVGDGGPAASAELNSPQGIAVDAAGNLLIADTGNGRIRVVAASDGTFYGQAMVADDIYTIAGNGKGLFSGDGGPATSASIGPVQLAIGPGGEVVLSDYTCNRIRVISE